MHNFDELDHRIIAALRRDGRAAMSKVAQMLGVSRATVENRLARMQESGAVLGFTIRVREDYGDRGVRAIMSIEVTGKSTAQVIKRLHGMPELHSLHTTNGAWDLVAEIHAANLSDFDRVLLAVRQIDGVLNSETSILLSSV